MTHGFFADPEFEVVGSQPLREGGRAGPSLRQSLAANPKINQYLPGLLSGVVLAGANNPPSDDDPEADGILTASEIESLDLNGVDLVVLSACDTARGEILAGEGVISVAYAFLYAGSRSVVGTLWEVEDDSAAEFMRAFYAKLFEPDKPSYSTALRESKLQIRHSDRARGIKIASRPAIPAAAFESGHPYYWAPFIFVGAR